MKLVAALLALVVLLALGGGSDAARGDGASCDEWFHGKSLCPDKCGHKAEAEKVLEGMNTALGRCLEETKPYSGLPIAAGVVKSRCIEGILEKTQDHYDAACVGKKRL